MNKFESLLTKNLSKKDLINMAELEQDMWSRNDWLWEYVKCIDCWKIHSKEDIYGNLPLDFKMQTVAKIEQILWQNIKCSCWSDTKHIYEKNEYIDRIIDRHNNSKWNHLTVLRNENWTIWWFMDWYIADFENIYKKELKICYDEIWEEKIKNIIESKLNSNLSQDIMFCSALWLEESKVSFYNVYEMWQFHTKEVVKSWNWNLLWLYEVVLNTPLHWLYQTLWGEKVWIPENKNIYEKVKNIKQGYTRDIFIHKEMWLSRHLGSQTKFRQFLVKNKETLNKIINNTWL